MTILLIEMAILLKKNIYIYICDLLIYVFIYIYIIYVFISCSVWLSIYLFIYEWYFFSYVHSICYVFKFKHNDVVDDDGYDDDDDDDDDDDNDDDGETDVLKPRVFHEQKRVKWIECGMETSRTAKCNPAKQSSELIYWDSYQVYINKFLLRLLGAGPAKRSDPLCLSLVINTVVPEINLIEPTKGLSIWSRQSTPRTIDVLFPLVGWLIEGCLPITPLTTGNWW